MPDRRRSAAHRHTADQTLTSAFGAARTLGEGYVNAIIVESASGRVASLRVNLPAELLLNYATIECTLDQSWSTQKIFEKDDDGLLNVGFNATLDVQCRTEIKVSGLIGHAVSANKKSASVGETEIGISQTLAWKLCSISPKTAVGIYFEVVTPGDTPLQPGLRGLIKKRTPIPDSASPNLLHEGCQPINKRTGVHSHPAMKRQLQTGGEGDVVAESAGAPRCQVFVRFQPTSASCPHATAPAHPHRAPGGLSSHDSPMFIALTADDAFQTPADTRSTRSMASSNNARRCPTAVCTSLSYTNYLSSPCSSRPDFQPDDEHRRRHRHLDDSRPSHGFQQQAALSA
ncbi:hypothetical protein V8E36_009017, partial [Tilletia maclaganii]